MEKVDVAVLGSSGLTGEVLKDILGGHNPHPNVSSMQTPGREELEEFDGAEVVFSALPHGESAAWVAKFHRLGSKVIDLSGDLRFPTLEEYEEWYPGEYPDGYPAADLLPVVYGLVERNRGEMQGKSLVSMPGCYPTATLLGVLPPHDRGLVKVDAPIIIDADSGASGRGKKPSELNRFGNVYGNAVSYNTGRVHRHVGEIELLLSGQKAFFSPTVIPIDEGMLVKATVHLQEGVSAGDVQAALQESYAGEPFVRVLEEPGIPDVKAVAYSDECHIGAVVAEDIGVAQIGSTLGNLRKGASSQAVQAFNVMSGYPEAAGLTPKDGYES